VTDTTPPQPLLPAGADAGTTSTPDEPAPPDTPDAPASPPPPPPPPVGAWSVLGAGRSFLDVSTDQGGNVWAVTADKVYFFAGGAGDGIAFDQASGLAQGKTTWTDTYWFGTADNPATEPVTFSAVAGGQAGEAFIGNIGMIGDRLKVDPATGAVEAIVGLAVTSAQQSDPAELAAQQQREVAVWHAVVDLNGTFGGTAYFGGFHGTSALHGMARPRPSSVCGCADYEEHVHPFTAGGNEAYGGDVHALALTPAGDLWIGDRKGLYFLPQGSLGGGADLFQPIGVPGRPDLPALDVFPGVDDWIYGVAVDRGGGLYVASYGNGLVYLGAGDYAATPIALPSAFVTGVDIDAAGAVWIATKSSGVVRLDPASGALVGYGTSDGLPSDAVRQVYVDRYGAGTKVYFATAGGIAVHSADGDR
jgi:hypothetical protein